MALKAPNQAWVTLPLTLQLFGTMVAGFPASILMKHIGRRNGFMLGTAIGFTGSVLSDGAIISEHFGMFCIEIFMLGLMCGFAQLYPFIVVEVVPLNFKSRAISLVLAEGFLAGILGPEIGSHTVDWLPEYLFAGSNLAITFIIMLTVPFLFCIQLPLPSEEEHHKGERRLIDLLRQPLFIVSLLSATIRHGVMALIMTATPLAMNAANLAARETAYVIQLHVVGMFAPSFLTGNLILRYGHQKILAIGLLLNFLCVGINLLGQHLLHYLFALCWSLV